MTTWTPIVPHGQTFTTPSGEGASWTMQKWNAPIYAFKELAEDTIVMSWSLEATQITGNPSELRLALPPNLETAEIGHAQYAALFYNDNWTPKKPTPVQIGRAFVNLVGGGQTYVAFTRAPGPGDYYAPRWSSTLKLLAPSYGYMGGTYLFGQIVLAVRPRST